MAALSRRSVALLALALALSIWAIVVFALPYFFDAKAVRNFGEARRLGLFVHISSAGLALLLGPTQFWMGWSARFVPLHRRLGMLYLISVAMASLTGIYLVATTRRGLVFGFGLGSLNAAWILATGFAYYAILRRQFVQHYEWMIRSYILTFVFVTFRLMVMLMHALKIGSSTERLDIAIWLSWIAPLLAAEAIMQWQKIPRKITAASRETLTI